MMDPQALLHAADRILLEDLARLNKRAQRAAEDVGTIVAQFDRVLTIIDDQQRLIGKLSVDIQELEQRIWRLENER